MENQRKLPEAPDVLIVGGGIIGSAIFRELGANGVPVALVEKQDFGWDVSAGSTEMAHGGFRYLMALSDWPLVFESLTERELLIRNAAHLARRLNFYMPLYRGDGTTFDFCIPRVPKLPITVGKYFGAGMFMMQAGMLLYEVFAAAGLLLNGFKPNFADIRYRKFNRDVMLKIAPGLCHENLVGGFRFTDCKLEDVERIVIENILAGKDCARANGTAAAAVNYCEAVEFERGAGGNISSVKARDALTGDVTTIRPKLVVNSTGVSIDGVCGKAGAGGQGLLRRVSGMHLITRRFFDMEDRRAAFAFWIDRKILFAISKGSDRALIGTTERDVLPSDGGPSGDTGGCDIGRGEHNDNFAADIEQLVRKTKSRFVKFEFEVGPESAPGDIYYTRVRPLKRQPSKLDPKAVSRADLIKWHEDTPNMVSVSGKLGPSRRLAETVAKRLHKKLRPREAYSATRKMKLQGGNVGGDIEAFIDSNYPKYSTMKKEVFGNLARRLGSRFSEALEGVNVSAGSPDIEPICDAPDSLPLCALAFAFEREFCVHIRDAMARTGNTKFFGEGLDCIEKAARYVGGKLGWSEDKIKSEIEDYREFIGKRRKVVRG